MVKRLKPAALLAAAILALAGRPALAQTPAPAPAAKPDQPFDAAKVAFEALPEVDRRAIQDALVWTGDYLGLTAGVFGRRTYDAIAAYQARAKLAPTGALDGKARGDLAAAARKAKDALQFKVSRDGRSGVEIGVPEKLLPKREANANGGTRWQSGDGRITLDTRAQAELAALYERNLALQAPGRTVTYTLKRPDFFVLAGETATGKFYTRVAAGPGGLRGFSIGYDKGVARELDRTVIAIANSFAPFPDGAPAVATAPAAPPVPAPVAEPPRPAGPIATGLAVAPGRVLTSAAAASCPVLRVAGSAARLVTADGGAGLAAIETDAARIAAPLALRSAPLAPDEEVVILAYAGGTPADLVVTPGQAGPANRVFAPLQPGAAGTPVLDRSGALVGLVGPMPPPPRLVAGIAPPTSQPIVPAEVLAAAFPTFPRADGAGKPMSVGEIVAKLRGSLVSIECAR